MPDFARSLGFWLYLFVWLPYTLVAVVYGFGSPWWRSRLGRSFWLSKAALSLILAFVLSVMIFGRYPLLPEIRSGLLTVVGCAAWYQLFAVLSVQRENRNNPDGTPRRRKDDIQAREH